MSKHVTGNLRQVLLIAGGCVLVIAAGLLAMNGLASSRKEPAQKPDTQKGVSVSAVPVEKSTVRLRTTGYGQISPVNTFTVSPKVSGHIVEKHPALEEGGMVEKGDVLFRIDDTDYSIAVDRAVAVMNLSETMVSQYRISLASDRERLAAVKKNTLLARLKYDRLNTLYENDRVGTLSEVETAEQDYNSLLDTEKTLMKTIALYPLRIQEAQSDLAKDGADLKTARLNLGRCTVTAPFSGRVQSESVETGAYITAGTQALTLADDRVFEIRVPLSDRDAFETLGLKGAPGNTGWFSGLEDIRSSVQSVTGRIFASMPARIHRVVRYDTGSRTLYIALRVENEAGPGKNTAESLPPLAEGMFCKVMLEGRQVENTVKVPLTAMNADNTVYVARGGRLKTLKVNQVTADGASAWVTGGFRDDDFLITSPLSNPVENTLLTFAAEEARLARALKKDNS
ncbi:MAG: HlyD family efflux transporter periplasmic adaptor subunit [Desulfobacterales bacterium]|nr:HlyD family efflux transporter periplasmic adaptor subunit [Desulfobacterales bacterium]